MGLECLPGLKSTTANLRTGQFNVFARLEVLYEKSPRGVFFQMRVDLRYGSMNPTMSMNTVGLWPSVMQ